MHLRTAMVLSLAHLSTGCVMDEAPEPGAGDAAFVSLAGAELLPDYVPSARLFLAQSRAWDSVLPGLMSGTVPVTIAGHGGPDPVLDGLRNVSFIARHRTAPFLRESIGLAVKEDGEDGGLAFREAGALVRKKETALVAAYFRRGPHGRTAVPIRRMKGVGAMLTDGAGRCVTMAEKDKEIGATPRTELGCESVTVLAPLRAGLNFPDLWVHLYAPGKAILSVLDEDDEEYAVTEAHRRALTEAGFEVAEVPASYVGDGTFASATSALVTSQHVVVPVVEGQLTLDEESLKELPLLEQSPLKEFAAAYPKRTVVPVFWPESLWKLGAGPRAMSYVVPEVRNTVGVKINQVWGATAVFQPPMGDGVELAEPVWVSQAKARTQTGHVVSFSAAQKAQLAELADATPQAVVGQCLFHGHFVSGRRHHPIADLASSQPAESVTYPLAITSDGALSEKPVTVNVDPRQPYLLTTLSDGEKEPGLPELWARHMGRHEQQGALPVSCETFALEADQQPLIRCPLHAQDLLTHGDDLLARCWQLYVPGIAAATEIRLPAGP